MGFEFTKEDKDNLNYLLFKFLPKLSISILSSMFLSRITKYKVSSFFQLFILLSMEEYINSFVPKWKDDKKPEITKAKKLVFSTPINIQKARKLQPAISSAQSLNPAHHEL